MKKSLVVTTLSALAIVPMVLLTVSIRENKADQTKIDAMPEIKPFESRSSEWGVDSNYNRTTWVGGEKVEGTGQDSGRVGSSNNHSARRSPPCPTAILPWKNASGSKYL